MSQAQPTVNVLFVNAADWQSPMANAVQQIKTAHALARQGAVVRYLVRAIQPASPADVLARYGLPEQPNLSVVPLSTSRHPRLTYRVFLLKVLLRIVVTRLLRPGTVLLTRIPHLVWFYRLLGGRALYEVHDLGDLAYRLPGTADRHRKWLQRAVRRANGLITVTWSGKRAFEQVLRVEAHRICVAPDAADLLDYPPPRQNILDGEPMRITYTGSLWEDRGVETLVRAICHLPQAWPVQLVIVGGIPGHIERLRNLTQQIGVASQVDFVGLRPHREVPDWLARADIVVLTLAKGKFAETYASPVKLFEYMATGRPMVVVDVPTTREIVDERAATFYAPEDPASLAEAIEWVVNNWSAALERAQYARRLLAQRYTYDQRARTILVFLEEMEGE